LYQSAYIPFLICFKARLKISFIFQLTLNPICYDRNNGLYLYQSLYGFPMPSAA
jgi:hypothetical protein